jgi:alpha-beta hydrolase superfamily lysophospholipase
VWAPDDLRVRDLRTITALARARWPHAIIAVAAESLGGAVAMQAFASAHPPPADRLILLAPAVWGWSDQPIPYRLALWLAAKLDPGVVLTPPDWLTRHIWASDNIPELYAMGRDPLMIWGARTDALYGLVTTMQRALGDAADLRGPTLYMAGAHDEIIPRSATLAAVRRLRPEVRTAWYGQGWHLLLRDRHADIVWSDVLAFIRDPAGPLPSGAPSILAGASAKKARLREVQHPA